MKEASFYIYENKGDQYVIAESDLVKLGKTKEELEKIGSEKGYWVSITLKPAKAGLEREVRNKCQVGDPFMGFRSDDSLFPSARFEVFVEKWWKDAPASMSEYDEFSPALADNIDYVIRNHVRPNINNDSDFLQKFNDSSKQ